MALTQAQLDQKGCGADDCDHDHSVLFLHPACHMGAGLEGKYVKATGVLELKCNTCQRPVAQIKVAAT